MDPKSIVAYIGAAIAIALGIGLLYVPPPVLAGEASTVGWAASFITGGLAAIGVTVAVPPIRAQAMREGVREGAMAARRTRVKPKP